MQIFLVIWIGRSIESISFLHMFCLGSLHSMACKWTKDSTTPPPHSPVSERAYFNLHPYYFCGSGVIEESKNDILLFRRKAFEELFEFLQHQVMQSGCFGRVYGPPGTGKSLAILAFASTQRLLGWNVTWLHCSDRDVFECIRFLHDCRMTTLFSKDDLENVLPHGDELDMKHLVILDGIRDSTAFPEHQKIARKCRTWYLMNRAQKIIRFVENSSTGVMGVNTEETDKLLRTEKFCLFSWELDDYLSAVQSTEFLERTKEYLDANISDESDESDESDSEESAGNRPNADSKKAQADVRAKFFFCGGSARYMFSISTEEVKLCIHEAVAAEQNIMTLMRGILGATSSYATHRLSNCFRHPAATKDKNECICTILSRYASEKLQARAGPDVIELLANSLQQDTSPSMEGWIFEMLFFSRLRHTGVYCEDLSGKKHFWERSEVVALEKQTMQQLSRSKIWLKPHKWNQGGYDAVYVDKKVPTVRFVQVTRGNTHSFKIRYFRIMMDVLGLKEGLVEIFFLVPFENMEGFAISEVTGQGQLASFHADQELETKWIKSKEISMVQIVGMQHHAFQSL